MNIWIKKTYIVIIYIWKHFIYIYIKTGLENTPSSLEIALAPVIQFTRYFCSLSGVASRAGRVASFETHFFLGDLCCGWTLLIWWQSLLVEREPDHQTGIEGSDDDAQCLVAWFGQEGPKAKHG